MKTSRITIEKDVDMRVMSITVHIAESDLEKVRLRGVDSILLHDRLLQIDGSVKCSDQIRRIAEIVEIIESTV